jgi:hypothetical protein
VTYKAPTWRERDVSQSATTLVFVGDPTFLTDRISTVASCFSSIIKIFTATNLGDKSVRYTVIHGCIVGLH